MVLDFNKPELPPIHDISQPINELIDKALGLERQQQPSRKYLGASRLGVNCSRLLQYEYQNLQTSRNDFIENGKLLRIFAAGHVFEELGAKWLRMAGFELLTVNEHNQQFSFKILEGKVAGHVDGIITKAPDSINIDLPAIWEMKSMQNKSWQDTVSKGLVLSKPIYAAQIAMYQKYLPQIMPELKTNSCLLTAINKDTAELYHELIPFDEVLADKMINKATEIITATEEQRLLPRLYSSPNFWECKVCKYYDVCWQEELCKQ